MRTPLQDSWANIVESFSRVFAPDLKFGDGPAELREYLVALGDLGAQRDQGHEMDRETLARVKDLRKLVDILLREIQ